MRCLGYFLHSWHIIFVRIQRLLKGFQRALHPKSTTTRLDQDFVPPACPPASFWPPHPSLWWHQIVLSLCALLNCHHPSNPLELLRQWANKSERADFVWCTIFGLLLMAPMFWMFGGSPEFISIDFAIVDDIQTCRRHWNHQILHFWTYH